MFITKQLEWTIPIFNNQYRHSHPTKILDRKCKMIVFYAFFLNVIIIALRTFQAWKLRSHIYASEVDSLFLVQN